ncbi:MAG TPA: carbohydrate-binding domain-containing protein [Clostridia bacterium]|nr:carbohydrate-binding domain-containing protein [Clostridia bacterium]
MKHGRILAKVLTVFLLASFSLGCNCTNNEGLWGAPAPTGLAALKVVLSASDIQTSFAKTDTHIVLNGDSATVTGRGVIVNGSDITITTGGVYVMSGTLSDGQIAVDATKNDNVHIVLNGASITNKSGSAVYASQCEKLVVTLAAGTKNALIDGGANFYYTDIVEQEPNGALFSKDDLTINGDGSLMVTAGFKNGISTKDNLLILSGDVFVDAADNALYGKDSVAVLGGKLQLVAGGDGIKTNTIDDPLRGFVLLSGGDISITSDYDGVQADTALEVTGATLKVTAGEGAKGHENVPEVGSEGLKSNGSLSVTNGEVTVASTGDCLRANGDMLLAGGLLSLSTLGNAAQSGGLLSVTGGSISVTQSFEGLEGISVNISDGFIDINAEDDAINASGGADGVDKNGAVDCYVNITGGDIRFIAHGDGVDSNGAITMSGGTLYAFINSTPDNGAMDCDGALTVTGGILIYGGTGAGKTPDDTSTQSYVHLEQAVAAGTALEVKKDGVELLGMNLPVDCTYLVISIPEITMGKKYEFYSGLTLIHEVKAGTGGEFLGGRGKGN